MMSVEFSAVAAPVNQNQNTSSAFAAALQRARQIAAKINPSSTGSSNSEPIKRSAEDNSSDKQDIKKLATGININSNANNISSSDKSSGQTAAAQAAAVAARVAAAAAAGIQGGGISGLPLGPTTSKDIKVPDRMVGLIIGRGGEQITRLQAESGCKIQMAPDSGGMPDRMCTLTGSPQAVGRAEDLISQIVNSRAREVMLAGGGGGGPPDMQSMSSNGHNSSGGGMSRMNSMPKQNPVSNISTPTFTQVEIMVPGPKVGLIIGKGGETIKQLQEKSGAKMIIIQEGPSSQEVEKPLRISGDPQKVEHAKELIYELMAEKDHMQRRGGRGGDGSRGMGGDRGGYNSGYDRGGDRGGGGGGSRQWEPDQLETTISIPAGKCGVIIGKGGETIRQINQQTGAYCEIDRKQPPTATEKVFLIKGTIDQIENVKRMFSEKLNMNVNSGPISGPMNGNGYGMNSGSGHSGGGGGGGGAPQSYGNSQWPGAPQQQFQQQSWPNPNSQQAQGQQSLPTAGGPGAGSAAAPGGNAVQINPLTGQPDYSSQWIEYYRSMGMHREAALVEEQAKVNKQMLGSGQQPQQAQQMTQMQQAQQHLQMQQAGGVAMQQMAAGQPQQQAMAAAVQQQQPAGADQSNGPDYSAQWAAYYRSIGKIKEAEAVEAQMKLKGIQPAQAQGQIPVASGGQQPAGATGAVSSGMYSAQAASVYGLGAYQAANPGAAVGFYGAGQQQPGATGAQYAYQNYAAGYAGQQPAASSESHQ